MGPWTLVRCNYCPSVFQGINSVRALRRHHARFHSSVVASHSTVVRRVTEISERAHQENFSSSISMAGEKGGHPVGGSTYDRATQTESWSSGDRADVLSLPGDEWFASQCNLASLDADNPLFSPLNPLGDATSLPDLDVAAFSSILNTPAVPLPGTSGFSEDRMMSCCSPLLPLLGSTSRRLDFQGNGVCPGGIFQTMEWGMMPFCQFQITQASLNNQSKRNPSRSALIQRETCLLILRNQGRSGSVLS